jgi:hypothetical protein
MLCIYHREAINSSMQAHARLHEQFKLHTLSNDERTTCQSMLHHDSSNVLVMPTHHINGLGDMMGFRFKIILWQESSKSCNMYFSRFSCNAFAPGNVLPIVRTMFHGHTLVIFGIV